MAGTGSEPAGELGSARRAYELIRSAIIEGRYRSGQRLVEQRIAEEFSLSRTPVREALRLLEAEGLVVSRRNRGAVVRPVSARDVSDLYELRSRLESLAAERAATLATPADLAELDAAIDQDDVAAAGMPGSGLDGVRALHRANARFHDALLRAADHPRLAQLMARTVDIPLVFQAFRVFTLDEVARSSLFHRLIRDAVAAGDPTRAGRLMVEHVLQGRDTLLASLPPSAPVVLAPVPGEATATTGRTPPLPGDPAGGPGGDPAASHQPSTGRPADSRQQPNGGPVTSGGDAR